MRDSISDRAGSRAYLASELLAGLRALPVQAPDAILAPGPCLVLAPHPDDETFGCGGLIALQSARRRFDVIVLTDGTGSHSGSVRFPAPRLAALREAEVEEAVKRLGLGRERLHFMRLEDRRAPQQGPELESAANRVRELLDATGAATLLTTWRCDPHADHQAASLIAHEAVRETTVRMLEFPVWGWTLSPHAWVDIPPLCGARVDISGALPAKRAAIAAYASQTTDLIRDDPNGARLPEEFISLFTGPYETFLFA